MTAAHLEACARGVSRPALLVALALVFAAGVAPRVAQYAHWRAEPETYYAGEIPVASTDSYRWFRFADERARGIQREGHDPLRYFPEGAPFSGTPAISLGMAALARLAGVDVYTAGQWLTIGLSSLFVWPLGLYCARLGAPLAALGGSLIGTFGYAYYSRTALHRVDTDGGNVFFMWLVALAMGSVRGGASRGAQLAGSAAAGLASQLFTIWYARPEFALVYAAIWALHLAVQRIAVRRSLLLFAVFAALALPGQLAPALEGAAHFATHYLGVGAGGAAAASVPGAIAFPSVLAEIQELQSASVYDGLWTVSGHPTVSVAGLIGFALFAWRHPRAVVPLLPCLALGVLGLTRYVRFLMFLTPIVGIGLGSLAAAGLRRSALLVRLGGWRRDVAVLGIGGAVLAAVLPISGPVQATRPQIDAGLLRAVRELEPALPAEAALLHTWGHGYLMTALTGRATFTDGESPDAIFEHLIDRGLSSPRPAELAEIAAFLARNGRRALAERAAAASDYEAFFAETRGETPPEHPAIVLLLTDKMQREFGNIYRKGQWDFETASGRREAYDPRVCRVNEPGRLRCERSGVRPLLLDPERGAVNGRRALAEFVRVIDGEVREKRSFSVANGLYAQLLGPADAETFVLHLLRRPVYESNYNQMFVLGRTDPERFRELGRRLPWARAYELIR